MIYYVIGLNGKKRKILILKKENVINNKVEFEPIAYRIRAKVEK